MSNQVVVKRGPGCGTIAAGIILAVVIIIVAPMCLFGGGVATIAALFGIGAAANVDARADRAHMEIARQCTTIINQAITDDGQLPSQTDGIALLAETMDIEAVTYYPSIDGNSYTIRTAGPDGRFHSDDDGVTVVESD